MQSDYNWLKLDIPWTHGISTLANYENDTCYKLDYDLADKIKQSGGPGIWGGRLTCMSRDRRGRHYMGESSNVAPSHKDSRKAYQIYARFDQSIRKERNERLFTTFNLIDKQIAASAYFMLEEDASYWYNNMKRDITSFVSQCLTCKQVKDEH